MDSQFETPITPIDEPKKSRTGLIIGIVILVILCCCCIGFGIIMYYLYFDWGDDIINFIWGINYQSGALASLIFI